MATENTELQSFLIKIAQRLEPVSDSKRAAYQKAVWLAEWASKKSFVELLKKPELLDNEARALIGEAVRKHLEQREPLQYIFGSVDFLDLVIAVEPPLLIPRPETEAWVDTIIQQVKKKRCQTLQILDLCTGTGCIGLSFAKAFSDARVVGVDIDPKACDVAAYNAKKNNIENFRVIEADLYQGLYPKERFDLIISNPPYVSRAEWLKLDPVIRHWETERALLGSDDGLGVIRRIISGAPGGLILGSLVTCTEFELPRVVIEIGATQGKKVVELFNDAGFDETMVIKDLTGDDRAIVGWNYAG